MFILLRTECILGVITHFYNDGKGRIDAQYMFNSESTGHKKLKVGDRVTCTARKISEDQPIVIYKIDSIDQDSWMPDEENFDNITPNTPVPLNTYTRVMRGEIIAKLNGEIAIDTMPETSKPIKLVISEIGCTFNPVIGDQVEIEAEFGVNHENPSDLVIIGYYGMKPNEQKFINGEITTFKKVLKYGLIDNKYLFYMDVLQHSSNQNMVPNKGDRVSSMVISSHQKIDDQEFFYRCTTLTKLNRMNQSGRLAQTFNEANEESEDEIDDTEFGMRLTKNEALKISLDGAKKRKQIDLIVVNTSNRTRRISEVAFRNHILASQVECRMLHRYHNIQAGQSFIYKIDVVAIISGEFKVKMDFKIDNKSLVRRSITLDVKYADEICGARVTHNKAYTQKIYSDKRETIRGQAPVSAPHFIDNR